ncbi:copper amine oxidase [Pectinatus sottacetonis]|uniref:copper amine oxidase n=1 Tax=Pectinatus sottacetonis TaxID=1002795 RepID=UPI0018C4ACF3|nr:copper amine oxidase [Pectinatus sottacetonis]
MEFLKRIILFVFLLLTLFSFDGYEIHVYARHNEVAKSTINKTLIDAQQQIKKENNNEEQFLENRFKKKVAEMKSWPIKRIDKEGTLLFSDSPETVYNDGILYEDTVKGRGRLYYYHVNGTQQGKKVVVVLKNMSNDKVHFNISRSSQTGPSADYLYVGKMSQIEYFGYQIPQNIVIPQNGEQILDSKTNRMVIKYNELVCGIYDFETDGPVKIAVVMMPIDADPYKFLQTANILPADNNRLRGTFNHMDRLLQGEKEYNPQKDGTVYFTLGDDKIDKYLTGVDATDGSEVKNYGNYGVLYYLDLPLAGMGKVHYYLQPLGGVYAGAVAVRENDGNIMEILPTPSERAFFGENIGQEYYADLGIYSTRSKLLFEYSPPGASNLPVNIIMMPTK